MARRGRWTAVLAVAALLAGGGYAAADVADVVPGVLTDEPLPEPYPPLPTAPGAVPPPPPAPVLAAPSAAAPLPDPEALAAAVGPVLADPAIGPAVSASVVDALTGQVLFEAQPATGREPASVAKLFTVAAALHRLGPDHVVPTRAVAGAAPGEVVLVAGGDVLLSAGAGDPLAAAGRAGLADLAHTTAAALSAQGVTSVTVTLDDGVFGGVGTGEPLGPGVGAADVSNGFVAPFSAVAVDAGRVRAGVTAPRQGDPGLAAAQAFADRLAERGLAPAGPPVRVTAPAGAAVLGEVLSAPLAQVAGYVLATSDNTAADALARLVAVDLGRPATFAGSGAAVLEAVSPLGLPTAGLRLADGSGLSDGSLLTASALTALLAQAASPQRPELRPLYADLPVAGLTGTLGNRFGAAGAALGLVRAKTGSLRGTSSLAGSVLDADGRLLLFAVLADRTPSSAGARAVLDRFAATAAACGC